MGWYERDLVPMKIGTVPHVVLIHGNDKAKVAPRNWVRIKESEGDHWHKVLIDAINPDGHIFAQR